MRGTGEPSRRARKALAAVMSGTATRTAFATAAHKAVDLGQRGFHVTGIGIGHALHHHRRAAADGQLTQPDAPADTFSCMADLEKIGLQQKCRQCLMLFQQASQVL